MNIGAPSAIDLARQLQKEVSEASNRAPSNHQFNSAQALA